MKTSLSTLDAIIFGTYLVGVMAIGIYAANKRNATKRDYFLAGDKLPWWMIGGSIVAANLSSHQLVGTMGVAYSRGFVAIITEWGAILLGFNALLWIFLPFYLRNGFYTMPEFLQKRFGGAARTTYSVLILLTYIFVEIGAVLYLGALTLHSLLDIPMVWSVLILAIATGAYTILGGLRAVIWTEMLQLSVLIFGMAALSYVTINAAGGISAVLATSKDWDMLLPANDPAFPWTMYLGGAICTSVFYCATNQFIVQRTLAAKSEWHARMGVVFADYLKFIIPFMIIGPALVAAKMFPNLEKADLVFPTLVKNLLPSGLVGLVMAGLIAAIMSHLSGAINSCTTILTMDVYLPYFKKSASETQSVMFGKISGAVIVVLGIMCTSLLMSHSDKPVFLYLLNAYGLFTPGIATMFLMGTLSKRTTHAGALTAGLLTVPMSIVMQLIWPDMPFYNRTGIVFWTCMAVCMAVSYAGVPKTAAELEGLIWSRSSLSLPLDERHQQRGLRNPFIWWLIVTAMVLFFYIRFA
jgi:SSS family solute:Na+ symporter